MLPERILVENFFKQLDFAFFLNGLIAVFKCATVQLKAVFPVLPEHRKLEFRFIQLYYEI